MEHKHNHRYREHFDGCQMGGWLGGDRNYWSSKQFLLMGLHRDLFIFTPSQLQCWSSRLKGIGGIWEGNELWASGRQLGGSLLLDRSAG